MVSLTAFPDFYPAIPTLFQAFDFRSLIILILLRLIIAILIISITTTEDAVKYYTVVKEVLGQEWLDNRYFRLGASRLANNLLGSILGKEIKFF